MICKILGLFVNPLTSDDKYSLLNRGNYLRNQNFLLGFFLHLLNLDLILSILKKNMTLQADVFLNFRTPKNVVR